MGWVWKNDNDSDYDSSSAGGVSAFGGSSNPSGGDSGCCTTRKVVRSQCRTEEVEPGKFIRKCDRTEQIFKDCIGRPTEMVQSTKDYTEEDVTDHMVKGSSPFKSEEHEPSYLPGLRGDIDAIERLSIAQLIQAAEEIANEFFNSFGVPHIFDDKTPSSHEKPGIHIEDHRPKETFSENNSDEHIDLSGLARDV